MEQRGLPRVEFEIRQDLIGEESGQLEWGERLVELLGQGLERLQEQGHVPR